MLGEALEAAVGRVVPGLSGAVVTDDGLAWSGAAGFADIATGSPARADTVYLWFSMTKMVTATAVMQLAERGALGPDDPVRGFMPEFPPEPTVRHLLSHSSGLGNPIPVRWVRPAASPRPDPHEFTAGLLARHGCLRGKPGERARYSNLGYVVLGEVVSAAGGRPYVEYVRRSLLEPLGMTQTDFVYRPDLEAAAATGYQRRFSPLTPLYRLLLPKGIVGPNVGRFVSFERFIVDGLPYGGLIGTAEDAARFLALHVRGGDGTILSRESVEVMQTISATGRKLDVGLGWFRYRAASREGPRFLEHTGGGARSST